MNAIPSERNRFLIGSAVIVAACFIAFAPALRAGFIWDDDAHVTHNAALRSADGLLRIWTHLDTEPQYYPLTHTSFWIDYHFWGLNSRAYHVENVLIHALVAIALWRLLKQLEVSVAFAAALIFAIHPLQAETVAWITERKNLLSALFEVLALIVYWPIAAEKWNGGRWNRGRYLAAFALFIAAMLSKTVAATMPAVILVLIWWKRGRVTRCDVLSTMPMFIVAALFGWITRRQEAIHVGAIGPDWALSLGQRILIASHAIWFYAAKINFPTNLTFSYPRWDVRTNDPIAMAFLVLTIAVLLALFASRRRIGRGPLAASLIFIGVLSPALGFVNTFPMRYSFVADHFQYLAGAALVVLMLATIARLTSFRDSSLALGMTVLVASLAGITFNRCFAFHDAESLWRDTLAKNPASWLAHENLGALLVQQAESDNSSAAGMLNEALQHFDAVQSLRPNHPLLPFVRAAALMKLSCWQEAIDSYRRGLAQSPLPAAVNSEQVHERIAEALSRLGLQDESNEELALAKLGEARRFDAQGHDGDAISAYEAYLALKPADARAHASLGVLYGRVGRFTAAADQFSTALAIDPNLQAAENGLRVARHAGPPFIHRSEMTG